jgi:hypothetical protein
MDKRVHAPGCADENVVAPPAPGSAGAAIRLRASGEMNMFVDRSRPADHVCPARRLPMRA